MPPIVSVHFRSMAKHVSDWHVFDPSDRRTYPKERLLFRLDLRMKILEEGDSQMFFPSVMLLPCSSIKAWRYLTGHDAR